MALGAKMNKKDFRVFCIIGDGESNEGQNWEAAMFTAHHRLDNLLVITDCIKLQIDGYTRDILDLSPLADKWRSFNWQTFEMDGHDFGDIEKTMTQALESKGKPRMIIAHTLKGKGHCAIENKIESHHVRIADEQAAKQYLEPGKCQNARLPY